MKKASSRVLPWTDTPAWKEFKKELEKRLTDYISKELEKRLKDYQAKAAK